MENLERSNGSFRPVDRYDIGHVQEVVRQAHDELRQLMQQRADIMKRIGTVKQNNSGRRLARRERCRSSSPKA